MAILTERKGLLSEVKEASILFPLCYRKEKDQYYIAQQYKALNVYHFLANKIVERTFVHQDLSLWLPHSSSDANCKYARFLVSRDFHKMELRLTSLHFEVKQNDLPFLYVPSCTLDAILNQTYLFIAGRK